MALFHISPRPIPKTGDDTPAGSLVRYIWRMSGCHQISICVLALIVASLSMLPLELQRRIINQAVADKELPLLVWLGSAFLVVLLVQGLLKFGLRLYQGWLSESAIRYNREHLARLQKERALSDSDAEEGRAVSVIGAEVDKLGGFVGEGLSQPVVNIGMLAVIAGYMLAVEPLVAAISFVFLVPQVLLVPIVQRTINRLLKRRLKLIRSLSDRVAESSDEEAAGEEALKGNLDRIYGNRMRTYLLKFALKGLINFLNALAPLCVLLVGGYLVFQGETTIGVIVAFMSGFERLSNPLRELMAYYRVAAQANVQHDMIARWM